MFSRFGKNVLFYSIGTVGLRVASFVLIPIYTYFLEMGEYGRLALLLQTAQILMIVINLGSRTALLAFSCSETDNGRASRWTVVISPP